MSYVPITLIELSIRDKFFRPATFQSRNLPIPLFSSTPQRRWIDGERRSEEKWRVGWCGEEWKQYSIWKKKSDWLTQLVHYRVCMVGRKVGWSWMRVGWVDAAHFVPLETQQDLWTHRASHNTIKYLGVFTKLCLGWTKLRQTGFNGCVWGEQGAGGGEEWGEGCREDWLTKTWGGVPELSSDLARRSKVRHPMGLDVWRTTFLVLFWSQQWRTRTLVDKNDISTDDTGINVYILYPPTTRGIFYLYLLKVGLSAAPDIIFYIYRYNIYMYIICRHFILSTPVKKMHAHIRTLITSKPYSLQNLMTTSNGNLESLVYVYAKSILLNERVYALYQ